jgi:opacity protein-like surface antigen
MGFVVGAGLETAISDNVLLRAEGTWTRLMTSGTQNDADNDYGEITGFDDTDLIQATVGISYMFN